MSASSNDNFLLQLAGSAGNFRRFFQFFKFLLTLYVHWFTIQS
nr:MAG TPA: hypothetical protein [Caudoviricetes sp.]